MFGKSCSCGLESALPYTVSGIAVNDDVLVLSESCNTSHLLPAKKAERFAQQAKIRPSCLYRGLHVTRTDWRVTAIIAISFLRKTVQYCVTMCRAAAYRGQMADRARNKFGACMFEPKVFWELIYGTEESTCDIVGTEFSATPVIRRPGNCALQATPLVLR